MVFKPTTNVILKKAVDEWITNNDDTSTTANNENIINWDISLITDTSELFKNGRNKIEGGVLDTTNFNDDISSWTVDKVTNMESMFNGASKFDQNLSSWKVDKVTNMESMFNGASEFDQDLSSWNISSNTNIETIFSDNIMQINERKLIISDIDNITFYEVNELEVAITDNTNNVKYHINLSKKIIDKIINIKNNDIYNVNFITDSSGNINTILDKDNNQTIYKNDLYYEEPDEANLIITTNISDGNFSIPANTLQLNKIYITKFSNDNLKIYTSNNQYLNRSFIKISDTINDIGYIGNNLIKFVNNDDNIEILKLI